MADEAGSERDLAPRGQAPLEPTGARIRARVPSRVARMTDKVHNTYGAFVDHALGCGECKALGSRCERAEELWREYKTARSETS